MTTLISTTTVDYWAVCSPAGNCVGRSKNRQQAQAVIDNCPDLELHLELWRYPQKEDGTLEALPMKSYVEG